MTINEIAKEINVTKRAIKYYEEQGLLHVSKDSNGYRNYSDKDVETLRMISVYRKLGISISDIKNLLKKEDTKILLEILESKESELQEKINEYEELKAFFSWIVYRFRPELSAENMVNQMDAQMKLYLNPDEGQYEKLKKQVLDGYRRKRMMRFHPVSISQRKFMRELQNKGYNDIFIPNMKKLSPDYKKYHDALTAMNQRICSELGLYYDRNYNLMKKK